MKRKLKENCSIVRMFEFGRRMLAVALCAVGLPLAAEAGQVETWDSFFYPADADTTHEGDGYTAYVITRTDDGDATLAYVKTEGETAIAAEAKSEMAVGPTFRYGSYQITSYSVERFELSGNAYLVIFYHSSGIASDVCVLGANPESLSEGKAKFDPDLAGYNSGWNALPQPVKYLDWDDAQKQLVEKLVTGYSVASYTVYTGQTTLDAGKTYVVMEDVTVSSRITVNGTVANPTYLILCDGATLTAEEGVEVAEVNALIICGQTAGTGELEATGGDSAAGIGGGDEGAGGVVTINGGTVTATGGEYAAGIGGGGFGTGGSVTINGGIVTATGGDYGAGIGGGCGQAGGSVTINGGTVTAVAGADDEDGQTVAIGAGQDYEKLGLDQGTVKFGGTFFVKAGEGAASAVEVPQANYEQNHSAKYVQITPSAELEISAESEAFAFDVRDEIALDSAVMVEGVGYSDTAWGAESAANVTLGWTNLTTGATGVIATDLEREGAVEVNLPKKDGAYKLTHSTGDLTSCVTFTVSGYPLGSEGNPWIVGGDDDAASMKAWKDGNTVFFDPARGTATKAGLETVTNAMGGANFTAKLISADGNETNDLVMVLSASGTRYDTLADALAADEESYSLFEIDGIPYLDWDDVNKQMTNAMCDVFETYAGQTTLLAGKTYVVMGDITNETAITVNGTAESPTRLILCDGKKLTAKQGIVVTVDGATTNALIICGQENGTGALTATGSYTGAGIGGGWGAGGEVTINGGVVTAIGNIYAAGIGGGCYGAGGEVTINGGEVTATGGGEGAGIGGGTTCAGGMVTINGGVVTATGGEYAAGIGGGGSGAGGEVTINGGEVTATGGTSGAGIGGGCYGAGGEVTINGGTLTATAGMDDQYGPTVAIGAGQLADNHGTLMFGGDLTFVVKAGATAAGATNVTAAAYAADHTAKYVTLQLGCALKIPEGVHYSYAVTNATAAMSVPATLVGTTNVYAFATNDSCEVTYALDYGYEWVTAPANPLTATITVDTYLTALAVKARTYTVTYDGNGAAGTMANDTFTMFETTNLTANAYTAVGYIFAGWTTNGCDEVAYADQATGENFVEPGETLALTAKWTVDPAGVKPADYVELTNMIAQATLPVTITLDADIALQSGDKVVIPEDKDVTFAGTGKLDVSGVVPQFGEPVVVGEGFADVRALAFFDAKGVSMPVFDSEGGELVLYARGESEYCPWIVGGDADQPENVVTAWVDEALTNLAGVVIDNGLPTATNAIDLAALADNFATYGYEPALQPLNALLVVEKDGGAPEYVKPVNWIGANGEYATLADALAAGETAVVPNFVTEEIPQEIVETGMGDDGETYTAVVENMPAEGVEEPVKAVRAEGLVEIATTLNANVMLKVTAQNAENVADVAETLSNALKQVSFGEAGFASVAFVDLSVYYNEQKEEDCELDSPITLHIPWPVVEGGDYGVARMHDGAVQTIPQGEENAVEGEYFTIDVEAGEIVLRVNKFSAYAIGSTPAVVVTLPAALPGVTYIVSNLTAGAEIPVASTTAGGATYLLPIGAKVSVTPEPKKGYSLKPGAESAVIESVPVDAAAVQVLLNSALAAWEIVPCDLLLYPDGDGAFKPATKTATYYGTFIGEDGVAGTLTVKMTKPNRKTGAFNLMATVKTLVDKQTYSFKAKKVTVADGVAAHDGALTFALEGSNKKSKDHVLAVTLGGDSLTGAFDGFTIDGARHVFADRKDPKREAILPYVGTWTGALATRYDDGDSYMNVFFMARIKPSGSAWVKVIWPDGKLTSCSAKAEVGADGVVAVPVTVSRKLVGARVSIGYRLFFTADGVEVVDIAPLCFWTKADGVTSSETLEFVKAGVPGVTAKEFKAYEIDVDVGLGPVAKNVLHLSASTGVISGSMKWSVPYVTKSGRERTKTISGKACGVVIDGVGFGNVLIKVDGVFESYEFMAVPQE